MRLFQSLALVGVATGLDMNKLLRVRQIWETIHQTDALSGAGTSNAEKTNIAGFVGQGMDMDPMQLLMASKGEGAFDKATYISSLKQQMKDKMYAQLNQQSLSPLLLQYAKGQGDFDKDAFLYQHLAQSGGMDETNVVIMRLMKGGAEDKATAKALLKKQMVKNMAKQTNDPLLPELFLKGDKAAIKKYMLTQRINSLDDNDANSALMKTLMWKKFGDGTGAPLNMKDIAMTQMMQKQYGATDIIPTDAYLMYKFLQTVGAGAAIGGSASAPVIPPHVILEIALGRDIALIPKDDFKNRFGVQSNAFVCRAHQEAIRVPCMVDQNSIRAAECEAAGCCYNTMSDTPNVESAGDVPKCYHNFLGRISSGIAAHLVNDDNIKALFGSDGLPLMSDLLEAKTWAETQMAESVRMLTKEKGSAFGMPGGQQGWWNNNFKDGYFQVHTTDAPSGGRDFQWKPHGPTAVPNAERLPDMDITLQEDSAKFDFIIKGYMDDMLAEQHSESYMCKLIPAETASSCFNNNFDALKFENGQTGQQRCGAQNCCWNEENLFVGGPVCFRSLNSGVCDRETTAGIAFWTDPAAPRKEECGDAGISRDECRLNPSCCYDSAPRIPGDPWCYKRGNRQLSSEERCDFLEVQNREFCFDNSNAFGKLMNRQASASQCETAGCCWDDSVAQATAALGQAFGGLDLAGPSCFKKRASGDATMDGSQLPISYGIGEMNKVCANDPQWPMLRQRQWEEITDGVTGDVKWVLSDAQLTNPTPAIREPCGSSATDRHSCIYDKQCCYEKTADPRHPWCYKPRYVPKSGVYKTRDG